MASKKDNKPPDPSDPKPPQKDSNDSLNLEQLRLTQDFLGEIGVKKHLTTVPIRKPDRQTWVRVHSEWSLPVATIELMESKESYLVLPALLPELPGEASPKILFPAISRQGVVFMWPVRPGARDGRRDEWSRSMLEAVMLAREKWTRIASNMSLGAYDIFTAADGLSDPVWPDVSFEELFRIASRGRVIDSLDHPILRQLRGER